MKHTTLTGAPCEAHAPRAEDLVGPATVGTIRFAALHDLASGLQAIGAAIDELDSTVGTDPRLRGLVDAAVEANDKATQMFVALRNLARDPGRRREPIELVHLVRRATMQASAKAAIAGDVPAGEVVVAIPVVAHILATLIDAAASGGAGPVEVAAAIDAGAVAIAITAGTAGPPPETIGASLAIAARALEAQAGAVQCGERDGRATYAVRLPLRRG